MENQPNLAKTYMLPFIMLAAIIAGSITGYVWPGATVFAPLGKVFINLMFCIVVPLVFASIASAIANMGSRARTGKIIGSAVVIFVVTGIVAAIIMYVLMMIYPPVLTPWKEIPSEEMGAYASFSDLVVNFFTASDFVSLLSRRAMLPLIIFSILFGFGVQMNGGAKTPVAKLLEDLSAVMIKIITIVTYYAPIAFFGFFADLFATYGGQIAEAYGRALIVYYPLCFIYIFTAFPLFAFIGGGVRGVQVMLKNIFRPAVVSLGTCSSVATIPTNMEVAHNSGIPKSVSDIVLPLGATMHMDGSCLSCVLKIAFMYGVFGLPFGGADMLVQVVALAVFSSVGMSGVPGGGYIGEYIICAVFFPNQMELAFPIIVTIGNLVDPPATMINAAGDYVVSFMVARFTDGKDWIKNAIA